MCDTQRELIKESQKERIKEGRKGGGERGKKREIREKEGKEDKKRIWMTGACTYMSNYTYAHPYRSIRCQG